MSTATRKPRLDRDRLALELRRAARPAVALAALAVAALVSALVILGNIGVNLPWADTYTTRVAVDDVKGVVPKKHTVRLSGIEVGRIDAVDLEDGRAILTITLADGHGPLYRDARLRLRPETPLQDLFLNVEDRGSPAAGQLGEDDVLASERTRTPVDVGRVLNVFNADTRVRLEQAIDEAGRGLADGGRDLRAALVELTPFLQAAQRLTRETAIRRAQTRRLVHNFRLLTEELASRDGQVRRLVAGGAGALGELAANDAAVEQVIADLPPTMRRLQSTFATVRATADELDPAFDALLPVAEALPGGLEALRELSVAARPAFAALRRPLPALTALVRAAAPTAAGLDRAFRRLAPLPPRIERIAAKVKPCEKALAKFFHNTLSIGKFQDERAVIIRGQTVVSQGTAGGGAADLGQVPAPSCAPGGPAR